MTRINMHLHSSFSDGENSPEEMVQEACRIGYVEITITDHVRRTSDWMDNYCREINRLKEVYLSKIKIYSGIEAKVINLQGEVDARREFFGKCPAFCYFDPQRFEVVIIHKIGIHVDFFIRRSSFPIRTARRVEIFRGECERCRNSHDIRPLFQFLFQGFIMQAL